MKSPGETITELVNDRRIEEVPETAVGNQSGLVVDQMAVSMAISLKRIADRLDALGSGEDMDPRLHNTITNLAWEAGRSFQAGTRTDR